MCRNIHLDIRLKTVVIADCVAPQKHAYFLLYAFQRLYAQLDCAFVFWVWTPGFFVWIEELIRSFVSLFELCGPEIGSFSDFSGILHFRYYVVYWMGLF